MSRKQITLAGLRGILVAGVAVALVGCPPQQKSSGPAGSSSSPGAVSRRTTIRQIGSTTLLALAEKWREGFNQEHPDAEIAVSGGGSGTGIKALISGTAEIANASRPIKDSEKQQAQARGVVPVVHIIAYDGMAVIVHPSNPVDELSIGQLSDIFSGKATNWRQVGGPDQETLIINRDSSSGTYEAFKELVVQMNGTAPERDYAAAALAMQSNQIVVQTVAGSKPAIGYCGLGYLHPSVKPLKVAVTDGAEAAEPTAANVENESYPISRPLYMYTDGEPTGVVADYLEYVKGPGQQFVEQLGYVPISEAISPPN